MHLTSTAGDVHIGPRGDASLVGSKQVRHNEGYHVICVTVPKKNLYRAKIAIKENDFRMIFR